MPSTRRNIRPRLRGVLSKPAPISFTDLQRTMHEDSAKATVRTSRSTRGAFGGISKANRAKREALKRAVREAQKDIVPVDSPVHP